MKREFLEKLELEGGGKLPKNVIDQIMDENGKDIEAAKSTITAERDNLKDQLATVQQSLKQFEGVDVKELQSKITTLQNDLQQKDTEYQAKIADMKYAAAVSAAVSDMKFSSGSAKKAFIADLTAKKLQLQDDKILGLDDFTKKYKEDDPDAFLADDDGDQLIFSRGSGGGSTPPGGDAALRAAFGLPTDNK